MKELYESNAKIQIIWLEDLQRILRRQGHTYKPGDGGRIDMIYKAITAIHHAEKIKPSKNLPESDHFQINDQFMRLIYEELFEFNKMGDEYICSTSEALLKCNGIKRKLDNFTVPLYFRGEHNFGWDLISKLGRNLQIDWEANNPKKVTAKELELMKDFQNRVRTDPSLKIKIFGDSEIFHPDDSGWWSIMQHYDEEHGTRMIDVTSSLFCALYFACSDWDGTIDSSVDGKLYLFPYDPGRGVTKTPETWGEQIIGSEDKIYNNVDDYFNIDSSYEIPRLRKSPVRNDRALSQDGLFVWQSQFDLPLMTFQIFPFRIHREFKVSILKELNSMGYTKERILSENRYGY